jgi:hypothetical protein
MLAFFTIAVSCVEDTNVVVNAAPPQLTTEPETNPVPFTVNVNCAPPTNVHVGLRELMLGAALIVNVCAFDVPPPGAGLTTVIDAVPAVATREAGTVAVNCVAEINVVVSEVPFQSTVEVETKFVPLTVKVNCGPPAVAQVGLIAVVVGTRLLMVMTSVAVPVPPALVALIVTLNTPPVVGVPEMSPVLVLTLKAGGNGIAL